MTNEGQRAVANGDRLLLGDPDHFPTSTTWVQSREEARVPAGGGMAAAKTQLAAEAGAEILRAGGNAVDAAVATAFAAGVVEPWMNGIGGGGLMVIYAPGHGARVVEYPMVAPLGATPDMFPLSGAVPDTALFGWPSVVDQANVHGARSVAIPGTVAGLALALEQFGTMSLAQVMTPAIRYASEGIPVTWHWTYWTARDLSTIARYPETARVFLSPEGYPLVTLQKTNPVIFRQPDLAQTLTTIAEQGAQAFYEGEIAAKIAGHLAEQGAPVTTEDFARYEAKIAEPASTTYQGYQVFAPNGPTGGPSLIESLKILSGFDIVGMGHNEPETLHILAQAFRIAFADRFAYLADPNFVDVPFQTLLSDDYVAERAAEISRRGLAPLRPGDRERLGVTHQLAPSVPEYTSGSTTHLSTIDKDGIAVSVTQTLLSAWGSRVVAPGTGVLLNNGMMWFDPEPGRPNSVEGGKRPLSNMAPLVITRQGETVASVGSSGGRLIMNCNAQIAMNLIDHGLTIQHAISAPRIDCSTPDLLVSSRIPEPTRATLARLGHRVVVLDEDPGGAQFASPCGIQREPDGALRGGADPFYPAMAVGVPPND